MRVAHHMCLRAQIDTAPPCTQRTVCMPHRAPRRAIDRCIGGCSARMSIDACRMPHARSYVTTSMNLCFLVCACRRRDIQGPRLAEHCFADDRQHRSSTPSLAASQLSGPCGRKPLRALRRTLMLVKSINAALRPALASSWWSSVRRRAFVFGTVDMELLINWSSVEERLSSVASSARCL